ncbi:MAG: DUF6011 domain-containing protein [bacterium]
MSDHCQICGRRLSNPVSIANHAGPVCHPRSRSLRLGRRRARKPRKGQLELFKERDGAE